MEKNRLKVTQKKDPQTLKSTVRIKTTTTIAGSIEYRSFFARIVGRKSTNGIAPKRFIKPLSIVNIIIMIVIVIINGPNGSSLNANKSL